MNEPDSIYKPILMPIGIISLIVLVMIVVNIYYLTVYLSIWLFILCILMCGVFIYFFMPIVKNQKLILNGRQLTMYSFGKQYNLDLKKDLEELVIENDEVISYRFQKDGMYYQLSPKSYYNGNELKDKLEDFYKKSKFETRVIIKK